MSVSYRCKILFLSDVHLGTPDCQAGMLLDFLRHFDADKIYLVGDIVDCWRMKRKGFYWPQLHNDVVQKVLKKARKGAEIIYIPGNHDEFLREYLGVHFGGIEVRDRDIHTTQDGRKILITHGDQFDMVVMNAKWLAHWGDRAYAWTMWTNKWVNRTRKFLGMPYWSISKWAKSKVKSAVSFIGDYERILSEEAKREGTDGILCGHIHHPANRQIGDVHYYNTGDWVESCTAIIEHRDGHMEVIDWAVISRQRAINAEAPRIASLSPDPKAA